MNTKVLIMNTKYNASVMEKNHALSEPKIIDTS